VREVSVPTKLFHASQLTTTSSVMAEMQEMLLEVAQPEMTQPSIQSNKSNKILISLMPQVLEVLNATALGDGSICKHHSQYKCYFKNSHMVVCHNCPNTVHVL
jgi:hypothetical protein